MAANSASHHKKRLNNYDSPTNPILAQAFKVLCIIAVSRTSLEHWGDTQHKGWKEHTKAIINRFHYSNVTAGLVLTTTAVLISSEAPVNRLMGYNTPASYILALVAFGAALLSVISGAAVLIMYETGTTHHDMETLKHMSRRKVIFLLLWLAWPSVCLAVATFCLYLSIFVACFLSSNILVKVLAVLSLLAFCANGVLALDVFIFVGKRSTPANPQDLEQGQVITT